MAINWHGFLKILIAFSFCLFICSTLFAQTEKVSIIWEDEKATAVSFHSHDLENGELKVTLSGKDTGVLGKFFVVNDSVLFRPIVDLTFGLTYQLKHNDQVIHVFTIPFPPNLVTTEVLNIFPSSQVIPANLLKIHIQFSQTMQEGNSKEFVKVLNKNGELVDDVFLDLQPELWNHDRTSLTLWLDPGRIKRDLQPNVKMGPPLVVGDNISVIVSKMWKDVYGKQLKSDFKKEFKVAQDDRDKPEVDKWIVECPDANSLNSLTVEFKEAIDYELACDAMYIVKDDQPVAGQISLKNHESGWVFSPTLAWSPGKYALIIEYRLEDLAGNNLNRLFDRDLQLADENNSERDYYEIPFVIGASSTQ